MALTIAEKEPKNVKKHLEFEGDGSTPIVDEVTIPAGYNFISFTNLGSGDILATDDGTVPGNPASMATEQDGIFVPRSTVNGGLRYHRLKPNDPSSAVTLKMKAAASGVDVVVEYSKVGAVLGSV